MIAFIWPILTKALWWALPNVLAAGVNYVEFSLIEVEIAEALTDPEKRRRSVLDAIESRYPIVPEMLQRITVEAAVILRGIGITPEALDQVEGLVKAMDLSNLGNAEKRAAVLAKIAELFPDIPERAARWCVEFALAKLRGVLNAA